MIRRKTRFISALFWIVTAAFFILLGYYIVNTAFFAGADTESIETDMKWYSESDLEIDLNDRSQLSAIVFDNSYTLHYEADRSEENICLSFETDFADAQVYLNDTPVYSTADDYDENALFSLYAPAPKLHFVNLKNVEDGDIISIKVNLYYNDGTDGISNIMYGNERLISNAINKADTIGIVLCIILFTLGVTVFVLHLVFRKIIASVGGLRYAALFILFSSFYSVLNSSVFTAGTFFTSNVVYILHCLTFAVQFLMLILFFSENVKFRASGTFLQALSVIQTVFIAASVVLAAMDMADFHITYFIMQMTSAVQCLLILIVLIYDFARKSERRYSDLKFIVIFTIFFIGSIAGYILDDYNSIPVIWLLSCIFLAVSIMVLSLRNVVKLLDLGTETEAIGKMAFTDGLTGVGNTAAFRKKMDHLELVKVNYKTIGIVQFDINNLKTVNDNLGHDSGDKLITDGSALISKAFGKIGDVYRVGGDEFVAIVCGDNAFSLCRDASVRFEHMMDEYNSDPTHKFRLVIAYGSEFYESNTASRELMLRDIQKQADEKMYANKRELKERDKSDEITTIKSDSE